MESSEHVETSTRDEGLRLIKAGCFAEAIGVLKEALTAAPDDAKIYSYLGIAYSRMGSKLHAIASFEESLRLEETPRSYYNLGQMYELVHRTDEAIREYRMAIEMDPDYAPARDALEKLHSKFEADRPEPDVTPDVVQDEPEPVEDVQSSERSVQKISKLFGKLLKTA